MAEEENKRSFAIRFQQGTGLDRAIGVFTTLVIVGSLGYAALQSLPALGVGDLELDVDPTILFVVFLVLAIGVFLVVVLRGGGKSEPAVVVPPLEGAVFGTCGHCGAPVRFATGGAYVHCNHCRQAVVPDAAHQAAIQAIAAQQADLEQARASRTHQRGFAASDMGMWRIFDVVMFGVRWLMGPVILIVVGSSLAGDPVTAGVGSLLVAAGGVGLGAVALVVLVLRRVSRESALRRALATLARTLRGRPLGPGALPVLAWLDRHWAASVEQQLLTTEASHDGKRIARSSLELCLDGRPALVVAAHAPHVRRIDLFLAAHRRRGPAAATALGSHAAGAIRALGFEPRLDDGGAHLVRTDSDPALLAPDRVSHALGWAAQLLEGG